MYHVIRQLDILLYPPIINILLLLLALVVWQKRRLALAVVSVSLVTLFFFSLPAVSWQLLASLETYPAIPPKALAGQKAQAIVVLGGGVDPHASEYGGPNLTTSSYERLRYSAFIQRHTGLPVMATGGYHLDDNLSEADIMKQILTTDFAVSTVWVEGDSRTTRDNAEFSAKILKEKGLQRIFLVTHSQHMRRAVDLFQQQGLDVVPAPTRLVVSGDFYWRDVLPSGRALMETRYALHEYLGQFLRQL